VVLVLVTFPRFLFVKGGCPFLILKIPFWPKMEFFCFKIFQRVLIGFKRLYPTFLDFVLNFSKISKISKICGLECKIQQHFVEEKKF
jgi:hypothetical protein